MSASPFARQCISHSQVIPTKKVLISDPSQLPDVYSSTPNGTVFSTTPGGTRIIYERSFLMNLKNSPLSRTPPSNLPSALLRGCNNVPMSKLKNTTPFKNNNSVNRNSPQRKSDDQQFDLEL